MSVDYWVAAETFYNTIVTAAAVIILVVAMVSGMIYFYSKSPSKKKIAAGGGLLVVVLSAALLVGHVKYQDFLTLNTHVTPLVRDRQKSFSGYTYRSQDEMDYFAKMHNPESVRSLKMYQESTITEPVTYIGKDEFFYYFEKDGEMFKQRAQVVFDANAETTQMVGSTFEIENEAFFDIGFRNPPYVLFDHIVVNRKEESEQIQVEDDSFVDTAEERFVRTWSF